MLLKLRFYNSKNLENFYRKYPKAKDILERLGKLKDGRIMLWSWENNKVDILSKMKNIDEIEEMTEVFRKVEYEEFEIDY
jgi:hypothetical protein